MAYKRINIKAFVLGFAIVLVPMFLVCTAIVIDFFYDRSLLPVGALRYLPIHLVLGALIIGTLNLSRDQELLLANDVNPSSLIEKLKWTAVTISSAVILSLVMFWPISNWSSQIYGGNGDGYNWRWQIWRMSQEFREGRLIPTQFDDVIAPYGVDLRLNDGYLSMYIGGIWNLLVRPTLAYNLTLVTSVFLNFFAARKLSQSVSSSQVASIIAGTLMASAPSITVRQMGHLNLCFAFVLCFAAIEGLKLLGGEKVRVWQPLMILTLAFLSSFYFFILSSMIYGFFVLIRIVKSSNKNQPSIRNDFARLALLFMALGVLISPFVLTRLHHDRLEQSAGAPAASARTDEYMYYSADPRTFFLPASDARIELPHSAALRQDTSPNTVESTPFSGYVLIGAVVFLTVFEKRWRWIVVSLWTTFTILALGPTLVWGRESRHSFFFPHSIVESATSAPVAWLLYGDITAIPGLSALRTPNRFAMVLPVIGVIAFSLVFEELRKRRLRVSTQLFVSLVVLLLFIPNIRKSNYWYNTEFDQPVSKALQIIKDSPKNLRVLVAGENCLRTISMANLQVEHRHPMIGCQTFSAAVPWFSSLKEYRSSTALASLQCDPKVFGLAPMNIENHTIARDDVLPKLKSSLQVGYVVFPKQFSCADQLRTQAIIEVLQTSDTILVDSDDYLIVST
jgi:hypothetical protein